MIYSCTYDIAWCSDSFYNCMDTSCFRHHFNKPRSAKNEISVDTWASFMDTDGCPRYKKEDSNDSD